ncbi:MAG TPA: hypothetical protein PLW86_16075 [Rhodocyclaceae bacterium]|nr:hypothetical protein [Rhodocyclaceae bacterium]
MSDNQPVALFARTVLIDGSPQSWRDCWPQLCAFRELARMLVPRDLVVRFRQAWFGIARLLFKPLHGKNLVGAGRKFAVEPETDSIPACKHRT